MANNRQILIGAVTLLLGALVYLTDRPDERIHGKLFLVGKTASV